MAVSKIWKDQTMRILVVGGAGAMASGTVRDLASPLHNHISEVVIADQSLERCQALAREIGDPRLKAAAIDVRDRGRLMELLAACDLCINAVPTLAGHQMAIFQACLAAHRPYVDYGGLGVFTVEQKKHHEAWKQAGVAAVLGLGADPGISNVLCKAVAERLDRIDRINLYWAAKNFAPESPVLVPPYSLRTVLAEYSNPSQQFLNGRLTEMPPQSGQETLILPAPLGRTEFMHTQHSEPLTVPFAEGIRDKGIREFTWKLHLPEREHEAWVGLCKAGFADFEDALEIGGAAIKPADYLDALIKRNIARNSGRIPEAQIHELHLAIGEGTRAGKKVQLNCAVIGKPHPAHAGYSDPGTSMGLAIGVKLMLELPVKPGVWGPEEYFPVAPFLDELRKRYFEIAEDVPIERAG
jgi:saccharopine dehydrogenase-like NADP-dependent oxidoreductase